MRQLRAHRSLLSSVLIPMCVLVIIFSLFGTVWLRSNVITIGYELKSLEEKKSESLQEAQALLAERARLMSIEKVGAIVGGKKMESDELTSTYVFPDRVKVVYVSDKINKNAVQASYRLDRE